ncbi:DUF1800 domain-containing protein [Nocardioides ferulae]|uniref:DUF1800 domain-containing protein n=1 Tax=Nocardioides ferulae TaxID=2340821 RepID=UPI000EB055BA|nr:DUF1800 domain-containing protein [Nocardioides ferulae]
MSVVPGAPAPARSRRQALRTAGAAAAAATGGAALATAAPAQAAAFTPGSYRKTRLLGRQDRHLVNRFGYGITPRLAAEVRRAGGGRQWFARQLATAYDGSADGLVDWWEALHWDPLTIYENSRNGTRSTWLVMEDYRRRTLLRRMVSPRPVLETMTEFWEHHFHVPLNADNVALWRVDYGEVIRKHALGRFADLLPATVLHPAMLLYLNAATSTKDRPNENLGRELLELHTVGVGRYTEDDVQATARLLTGWWVDMWKSWERYYRTDLHATGPVKVLGFSHPNSASYGVPVTKKFLDYLAHHPATARHIATKLARVFVSDQPPAALVDRLAKVYLANDTRIKPVLKALVASKEFRASVDAKLRDGDDDVVATYLALGIEVEQSTAPDAAANVVTNQVSALGLSVLSWPRPDGQPLDNASWASPTRAMASMSLHWNMAHGWWPKVGMVRPAPADWVPEPTMPLRDLVDHLSRRMLHRPSTATLLEACCAVTKLEPDAEVVRETFSASTCSRLLGTILDSPQFYRR